MPELPEVETLATGLREDLLGRSLERVKVYEEGVLHGTPPRIFRSMRGCRLVGLTRRGKFLFLHFANGTVFLFHLKMTGRLVVQERKLRRGPWERLQIEFEGWDSKLSFIDPRKFGYLAAIPDGAECPVPLVADLGPDALTVTAGDFREILAGSRRPVKALLLDQKAVAGLGNIYVDECLHRAGIHPSTPASGIDRRRADALHRAVRRILRRAIECGGSTVRSYRDSRGTAGTFQRHHRVYGRRGEACRVCGGEIEYARIASRGTHFCPVCQKVPSSLSRRRGKKPIRRRKGGSC